MCCKEGWLRLLAYNLFILMMQSLSRMSILVSTNQALIFNELQRFKDVRDEIGMD